MLSDDLKQFLASWHDEGDTLLVQTSGSTGTPKVMAVEKRRMLASARMTCDFFHLRPGDTALLCLPLEYIAGKMMVVRSLERGLRLLCADPSDPAAGWPRVDFAAMVPLQVCRLLQDEAKATWLRSIRCLLLGGGAIDPSLEHQLQAFPHDVWSSYGMTETLSHIALRRIGEEWYTPLEGVALSTTDEGCLVIDAPLVCPQPLTTNDVVQLRADGRFRVLGRKDNVVCSGGIKIHLEQVEAELQPSLGSTFCLSHRPDPVFGEALVMLSTQPVAPNVLEQLPRYHRPKHIVNINELPLTPNGKIDRKKAWHLAQIV